MLGHDVLTLEQGAQEGEALIRPVMAGGKRLAESTPLADSRALAAAELARLPAHLRRLETAPAYPVEVSPALRELARAVDEHRV